MPGYTIELSIQENICCKKQNTFNHVVTVFFLKDCIAFLMQKVYEPLGVMIA